MGLVPRDDVPLFGLVSRFSPQKGIDLVLAIADALVGLPAQLVMAGTGDRELEAAARACAERHPGQVAAFVGFDEGLAHLIEAGADVFLMPSRFEPCGMNQMYSQRYGTPPIVHATGGLVDSVTDAEAATLANGTGWVFKPATRGGAARHRPPRRGAVAQPPRLAARATQRHGARLRLARVGAAVRRALRAAGEGRASAPTKLPVAGQRVSDALPQFRR